MLLHLLPAITLASAAFEASNFGFEWQQRLSSLGLEENNVTSGGCEAAVRST